MNLDEHPLVSICMPAYNHENYVQDAIQSIIEQEYQNIELLIINDGSTDDTNQKIEALRKICEERFIRFIYINRKNQGLTSTLNELLELSKGVYFSPMASDDLLPKNRISSFINYFKTNLHLDFCYSGYYNIDEEGDIIRKVISSKVDIIFNDVLFGLYNASFISYMFKTHFIREIGAYSTDVTMEDWDLALRLTYTYGNIHFINDTLYCHRLHETNTHKLDNGMQTERLKILSKYHHFKDYKKAYFHWKILRYNLIDEYVLNEFKEWLNCKLAKSNSDKYIIYGSGTFGNLIKELIGEKFIGFIDQNTIRLKNNHEHIIISVLGRENTIIQFLKDNFDIKEDKIIVL